MMIQAAIALIQSIWRIFSLIRTVVITFLVTTVVTAVVAAGKFISMGFASYHKRKNRQKIAKKRSEVEHQTNKLRLGLEDGGILVTEEKERILSLTFTQVLEDLRNGKVNCVQVLRAYQAKALEATEKLNCITEFISEAEDWARNLDGSPEKLPLHGIPFSVKDVFSVAGYDTTAGLAKNLENPAQEDSILIQALKSLGAVPFCKTNVPQLSMSYGSSNPVWGETKNPFNHERSPGGSSSGDAALVSYGGALFGVGTDLAGSLRIPAAFCGIATLKATPLRLSTARDLGIVGMTAVPGILARDVDTVILIHKLLWENGYVARFDTLAVPLLWQHQLLQGTRKLRIGFYDEDPAFPATPGVKRAVQMCRQVLEGKGHQLVPFSPLHVGKNGFTCLGFLHADQLRTYDHALEYEDVDHCIRSHFWGRRVPFMLRPMLAPLMATYSQLYADFLQAVGGRTTGQSYQLWNEMIKKVDYKKLVLQQWRENDLDLCIGPVFICPPPQRRDIESYFGYAATYNYLDMPAGVVPATVETEADQQLLEEYPSHDSMLRYVKETTRGATGMPIGVQVIGQPFQDELVLRGMKLISEGLQAD